MKVTSAKLETKDNANVMVKCDVPFDIKANGEPDEDGNFRFEGFGSTFGNIDKVDDVVVQGAFKESLVSETPVILWQHDRYEPIGMPEQILENEKGLWLKVVMPGDDDFVKGRVMPQLRIKSVKAMSIGFIVEDFFIKDGVRFITKARLKEVSLVTFPANDQAEVTSVKTLDVADVEKMNKRELETYLRESGLCSKNAAVLIASKFPEAGEPSSDGDNEDAVIKAAEKVLGIAKHEDVNYDAVEKKLETMVSSH